jgi:hypothetical protein
MHVNQQPAGWYQDPQGTGQRYWDGTAWTEHVAPAAAPAAPQPQQPYPGGGPGAPQQPFGGGFAPAGGGRSNVGKIVGGIVGAIVVVVGLLAVIGGLFGKGSIDHSKAEDLIRSKLTGPPPTSISCPSGVEEKKGATFDCTVVYPDGTTATVTVHQINDSGTVEVSPSDFHAH